MTLTEKTFSGFLKTTPENLRQAFKNDSIYGVEHFFHENNNNKRVLNGSLRKSETGF